MQLLGNRIAYTMDEDSTKKTSLILTEPTYKKIVSHVSPAVTNIQIGDEIIVEGRYAPSAEIAGKKYFFEHIENVMAVVEHEHSS